MSEPQFDPSAFLGSEDHIRRIQVKYAAMFRGGEAVLDLGCGNGVFLELLSRRSVRAVGVDTFPACVDACRSKGLDVRQAELMEYLAETTERFDGVFCSHIVEHLPPHAVQSLIGHARRILNPGGRIIIVTPNPRDIDVITERFWLDITHVRPYPIPLLVRMLEHGGFRVEQSGLDPDSAIRLLSRNPMNFLRRVVKKIRWGEYWGKGDSFVVGIVR